MATALYEAGHKVSVVDPSRIKSFAQSELLRTKTDRIDAALIARFCRMHEPESWTPAAPEIQGLQGLVCRHAGLLRLRADEQNRLDAPIVTSLVRESMEAIIAHLNNELARIEGAIENLFKAEVHLKDDAPIELGMDAPGGAKTRDREILDIVVP